MAQVTVTLHRATLSLTRRDPWRGGIDGSSDGISKCSIRDSSSSVSLACVLGSRGGRGGRFGLGALGLCLHCCCCRLLSSALCLRLSLTLLTHALLDDVGHTAQLGLGVA